MNYEHKTMKDLLGLVFVKAQADHESITLTLADGNYFKLEHIQDCCENVNLEDVIGDLSDLEGTPILLSEEVSSKYAEDRSAEYDSYTWTFYKLATIKGYVDLRFFGISNGHYSEGVDLVFYSSEEI